MRTLLRCIATGIAVYSPLATAEMSVGGSYGEAHPNGQMDDFTTRAASVGFYKYDPWIFEINYFDFEEFYDRKYAQSIKAKIVNLQAGLKFEFTPRFSAFAKLGLSHYSARYSYDFGIPFGPSERVSERYTGLDILNPALAVEFSPVQHLALTLETQALKIDSTHLSLQTLGAKLYF